MPVPFAGFRPAQAALQLLNRYNDMLESPLGDGTDAPPSELAPKTALERLQAVDEMFSERERTEEEKAARRARLIGGHSTSLWEVEDVIDGDTVRLKGFGNVRVQGAENYRFDAREMGAPGGPEAKEFLEKLVQENKAGLRLKLNGMDSYGRPLVQLETKDGVSIGGMAQEFKNTFLTDYIQGAPRSQAHAFELRKRQMWNGVLRGLL